MTSLGALFHACGLFWTLALAISFACPLIWQIAFFRKRRAGALFIGLAFAPLIVGTLGSLDAFVTVSQFIENTTAKPAAAQLAQGRSMAMSTTCVGLAGSGVLLLLAVVGRVHAARGALKSACSDSRELLVKTLSKAEGHGSRSSSGLDVGAMVRAAPVLCLRRRILKSATVALLVVLTLALVIFGLPALSRFEWAVILALAAVLFGPRLFSVVRRVGRLAPFRRR